MPKDLTTAIYTGCVTGTLNTLTIPGMQEEPLKNFTELQRLYIEECNLESLNDRLFGGLSSSLYHLELTYIGSPTIEDIAFRNISRLTTLKMTFNDLPLIQFPIDLFCSLSSLVRLNLSQNHLNCGNNNSIIDFFDGTQSCVYKNMMYLDLSGNCFPQLSIPFGKMSPYVVVLKLQNCHITSIEPYVLNNLTYLAVLYLDDNFLTDLPVRVFQSVPRLGYLNLMNNNLSYLPPELFQCLDQLQHLVLTGNKLFDPSSEVLSHLYRIQILFIDNINFVNITNMNILDNMTHLTHLFLMGNYITNIADGALRPFTDLTQLWLQNNKLEVIRKDMFIGLQNLEILSLAANGVSQIGRDTFIYFKKLKILSLSRNKIKELPQALEELTKLQSLYISMNKIDAKDFKMNISLFALTLFNISYNQIHSLQNDAFSKCPNIRTLDMANNNIEFIDIFSFRGLDKLRNLNLRWNQLTDIHGSFINIQSLQKLNLYANRIRFIEENMFPASVIELDLTCNSIEHVGRHTFYTLTQLKDVHLQGNIITNFPREVALSAATISPRVFLLGNWLDCLCENAWIWDNHNEGPTTDRYLIVDDNNSIFCQSKGTYMLPTTDHIKCEYKELCFYKDCPCCYTGYMNDCPCSY